FSLPLVERNEDVTGIRNKELHEGRRQILHIHPCVEHSFARTDTSKSCTSWIVATAQSHVFIERNLEVRAFELPELPNSLDNTSLFKSSTSRSVTRKPL